MPSYIFPKKNAAFVFYVGLVSQANTKIFQANPTLATGDAKISKDGGALANLATLPDVDPDSGKLVKVSLSADEMNADNIQVILSDAAGDEWCDLIVNIQTSARQVDDLAYPTTSGRSLLVSASGAVDVQNLEAGAITDVEAAVAAMLTATVADSIPADGTRPSIAQAAYMITQYLLERAVVGTTCTVKKPDGSTALFTLTLNSASAPTSVTRAT